MILLDHLVCSHGFLYQYYDHSLNLRRLVDTYIWMSYKHLEVSMSPILSSFLALPF